MKSSKYRTIETRHKTPIKYSFMKKSKNGITFPYMIYDLFNDHTTNPESIDRFDIGGCACFIDYNLEGKTKEDHDARKELYDNYGAKKYFEKSTKDKEEQTARRDYNDAVRMVCEAAVDIKACDILTKNLQDGKSFELTPRQIVAFKFD